MKTLTRPGDFCGTRPGDFCRTAENQTRQAARLRYERICTGVGMLNNESLAERESASHSNSLVRHHPDVIHNPLKYIDICPASSAVVRPNPGHIVGRSVGLRKDIWNMVSRLETGHLTALGVKNAKQGRHGDGGGLYLVVDASGAKRWLLRIMHGGRRHDYGLGGLATVSLKEAREIAYEYRRVAKRGGDPVLELRAETSVPTFGDFADQLVNEIAPGFRNEKHVDQWRMTLTRYCASIRQKRVSDIGTEDVLECLRPLWNARAETASRLRGRIERVLDAAKAKGLRSGENPARWRGHLDTLLPKRQRLQRGHHAALPYSDVPALIAKLRSNGSISALALEFTILTAARSGEIRGMTWAEIDEEAGVWTVPAHRMKVGREHRVPLSERASDILTAVKPENDAFGIVFPGSKRGNGLSVMALNMMLRRVLDDGPKVTVHGFRSSFRDWCGEEAEFNRDIVEAALAHTVGNAVERAYRRGDALEKRRKVMHAWMLFIEHHN